MDMDGMTVMVGGVVEDTVGDEDAEGEDEWVEQPYHPQYVSAEVMVAEKSEGDAHVQVKVNDEGGGDSLEEVESEESEEEDDDDEFVLKTRRKTTVHSPLYARDSGLAYLTSQGRSPSAASYPITKRSSGNCRRRSQPGPSSSTSLLPIPVPVPNLTKKSRGRRVPTMASLEDIRSAASGAGRKRQSVGGKSARMYLCEVEGCGKCFARGEHLKRHVRSIHTYEKREVFLLSLFL